MEHGHRASYPVLIGVTLFRLLWFASGLAAAGWGLALATSLQPTFWPLVAFTVVLALMAAMLLWSEARFLADAVVWFEPTLAGFRCRRLGRRRVDEVAWTEVTGIRLFSRSGRGRGPTGRVYLGPRGRYVMDWWSLPQARALAGPCAAEPR